MDQQCDSHDATRKYKEYSILFRLRSDIQRLLHVQDESHVEPNHLHESRYLDVCIEVRRACTVWTQGLTLVHCMDTTSEGIIGASKIVVSIAEYVIRQAPVVAGV